MKNMILTLNLEVIIPEVEKTLDDFFNELFIRNYIWLIILVVITLILLLFFIIFHSKSNSAESKKANEYIKTLEKRVAELEKKTVSLSSANRNNLSELNKLKLSITKKE